VFTQERPQIETNVTAVLDSLACRPNLVSLAERLPAPDGLRSWTRLVCTDEFDAWLIAWGAASEVGVHDHGDSHGAIQVLSGSLVEAYRESPRARWRRRTIRPGRTIEIPPTRIHSVSNPAARTTVSLHVYSPPLQQMNFFPEAEQLKVSV
jgi:cysteine dioxygenase